MRRAVAALDARQSLAAKVRQKVDLFGHQLVGSGTYAQQGRGADRRLRMELKIQVADQISSMQQVSDGAFLWMHQDLAGNTSLTKIDLARVRRALEHREQTVVAPSSSAWLMLGGLPKLLQNLDTSFHFAAPSRHQLDRVPVWTLRGEWKPTTLVELLPDQKNAILAGRTADLSKLPEQVPDRVVVLLGQEDLIPYRIEYWRTGENNDKSTAGKGKLLLIMELFEVQVDGPLDPRQFTYRPGDLDDVDVTQAFLQSLGIEEKASATSRPQQRPIRR